MTALLFTEPALPQGTSTALGVMALIGLAWRFFAAWVLTHNTYGSSLAGSDLWRAVWAVSFSSVFVVGALLVAYATAIRAALAAAARGGLMLAVAVSMLIRARRTLTRLIKRREELERQLRSENT